MSTNTTNNLHDAMEKKQRELRNEDSPKKRKPYIPIIAGLLVVLIIVFLCFRTVQVPRSSSSFTGKPYKEVVKELRGSGFINIKTVPDDGSILDILKSKNDVTFISIADQKNFDKGDPFRGSSRVIIKFKN